MMASITCGNCSQTHASVSEVRECYGGSSGASVARPAPATAKQLGFIGSLRRDLGLAPCPDRHLPETKEEASEEIKALLAAKEKPTESAPEELEDGIYRSGDGNFYKVYHTVHGANQQVAKLLVVDEETKTASWEYRGKSPLGYLKPWCKLGHEEAARFGQVYGSCISCLRDLTDERSLAAGYGATCASNHGWPYPTKEEAAKILSGSS